MAKNSAAVPALLISELDRAEIAHTIIKGAIFYNDVKGYVAAQKIIRRLERELPQRGYSKYGNKKVKLMLEKPHPMPFMGLVGTPYKEPTTFDSEDEADYFFHLKDLMDAGQVARIEIHPRLELFPAFTDLDGKQQNHIIYTPDFFVEYTDGRKEYIDVKGMTTEAGDLRRKLYDYLATQSPRFGGVPLRWIASNYKHSTDPDGWIDWDELQKKLAAQRKTKKAAEAKKAKELAA